MIKKEDFEFGNMEYYIEDKYVFDSEEYLIVIGKNMFDERTIQYINTITEKYKKEKDKIFDFMLEHGLREHFSSVYNYSDEYVKNNMGRPQITIYFRRDEEHPECKYEYYGSLEYCENKLDEHIISVDFLDDFKLLPNSVGLDG